MRKRLTLEEVKRRLKLINPNIEILSDEYKNNTTKLYCKCLIDNYKWYATWNKLSQGKGCPECGGVRTDYTIDDIKNKLKIINSDIEILSNEYIGAGEKLKCKCLIDGHIWYANWRNLQTGKGCPICGRKKIGKKKRLCLNVKKERLKNINPDIEILSEKFINGTSILKCKCKIDGCIWESIWNNLSKGQGCPECKNRNTGYRCRLSLDYIKKELYNINPNIEIIDNVYINAHTKMKCKCLIDGYIWETKWAILKQGCGCPECSGTKKPTLDEVKRKLKRINSDIMILSNTYKNNKMKLKCMCNNCNTIWYATWDNLSHGSGCPRCVNSKGEKQVEKYLQNNNIDYVSEYVFNDLKGIHDGFLKIDFYLPEFNLCIEYDGRQHFEPVEFFGGKEQFKIQKINDKLKDTYCRNNNIGLLRIPYWEFDNIGSMIEKFISNMSITNS